MTVQQRIAPNIVAEGGRRANLIAYGVIGAVVLVLLLLLLRDTAWAIVETWYGSTSYNHGFLIIPICLYLAWQQRDALSALTPAPSWRGAPVLLAGAIAWLLGAATGTLVVQEFSLILIIQAAALALFGWQVCRAMTFPLLYLYFAVPFGDVLIPPLQTVTAMMSVAMLRAVDIPVFSDGTLITIPTGSFVVAEACSGLRFLTASIAVGTLFAGLIYRTWTRRILFMILSVVVPILANGTRAFGIIWLAYMTTNEVAMGIDHIIYGWLFFSLVTFIVLGLGMMMRERELAPAGAAWHSPADRPGRPVGALVAGILVLVFVGATTFYAAHVVSVIPRGAITLAAPEVGAPFARLDGVRDPLAPVFANADAQMDQAYGPASHPVFLHVGYYRSNRRGAQSISSSHDLADFDGWLQVPQKLVSAPTGDDTMVVQQVRLVRGNQGRVLRYWYWTGGRLTGNPYLAKLLDAGVKLFGGLRPSAIIVVAADYTENAADADRTLNEFGARLGNLAPTLARALAPAGGR
jgi:exosortase A